MPGNELLHCPFTSKCNTQQTGALDATAAAIVMPQRKPGSLKAAAVATLERSRMQQPMQQACYGAQKPMQQTPRKGDATVAQNLGPLKLRLRLNELIERVAAFHRFTAEEIQEAKVCAAGKEDEAFQCFTLLAAECGMERSLLFL